MNAHKKILGLMAAACMAQAAVAVPATPRPITVRQADGTLLTIVLRGDEHGHIAQTTDGYPLWFNQATANYEYATLDGDGQPTGCGLAAKEAAQRTDADLLFLSSHDGGKVFTAVEKARLERMSKSSLALGKKRAAATAAAASQPKRIRINDFPTIGEQHTLVILIEFSDTKFTTTGDPYTYYDRMLNEEGFTHRNGANGSSRDFYMASSNGLFQPQFDVVGPVTMPNTCAYYGGNVGGGDSYTRIASMIRSAVTAADSLVDYSQYDYDGDGYIDNIYFFYAGYGEADSGKTNTIWPHSYSWDDFMAYLGVGSLVVDGKKMGSYACSQEINGARASMPVGIGTFTHEFGHVLGLPDLYDVNYGSAFTPGSYDTMDQGSYNNNQNTPPTFSAYERAELGWLDYTELAAGTDTLSVLPDLKKSNKAYMVPVEGTSGREFFVLENRQQEGWDSYLPGHGMLLWHIDHNATAWAQNTVNTTASHQRVDIVEADNRRTSGSVDGDPFPGASNVTSWDITSWAGKSLLTLDDIEERDSTIYLMLGGLGLKLATPTLTVTETGDSSLSVKWAEVDMAKSYTLNVTQDGKAVAGYENATYAYTDTALVTGLTPSTDYTLTLVASRGSYSSDTATATATTQALAFEKYMPTGMTLEPATGANGAQTSLVATWDAMAGADDYLVSLRQVGYATASDNTTYDFTQRDNGMPEGWTKSGSFTSTSGMYVQAPSLRLSSPDHYLLLTAPTGRIDSVAFWGKANSTAKGTFVVETCTDGQWAQQASYDIAPTSSPAAQVYRLAFGLADSVRIRFERVAGSMYIDNVTVRHHALQRADVEGYQGVSTGGATTYTFTGLEAGQTYSFTVRGKQGERLSYASPETTAKLANNSLGIGNVNAQGTGSPTLTYDLQGRRVQGPRGLHIKVKDGKAVKTYQQ